MALLSKHGTSISTTTRPGRTPVMDWIFAFRDGNTFGAQSFELLNAILRRPTQPGIRDHGDFFDRDRGCGGWRAGRFEGQDHGQINWKSQNMNCVNHIFFRRFRLSHWLLERRNVKRFRPPATMKCWPLMRAARRPISETR